MTAEERTWFCEQVQENKVTMYRLARSILQNEEQSRDAVQETLCIAWEKLDTLRSKDSFRPWVLRILSNAAYGILRQKRVEALLDEEEELPAPETDVDGRMALREAVDTLGEELRTVIVLFYYEDMSVQEISGVLGISSGAVKTRLSRARQRLREVLTEREISRC